MNEPQIELIQEKLFIHYHTFDASISAKNGILFERVQIVMGALPKKCVLEMHGCEPRGYDRIFFYDHVEGFLMNQTIQVTSQNLNFHV
jgi:hypothetical protein